MKNKKTEEELRIENEILKIKLAAQYGDQFQMHSFMDMPPAMENEFLKNIIAFEEKTASAFETTIHEKIGKPSFRLLADIPKDELKAELIMVMKMLEENDIHLHFTDGPYEDEVVYRFITEEFIYKETGALNNFIYEEFYPNHKSEITKGTHEFIARWFKRDFNEYSIVLGNEFTLPSGETISRDEMIKRINTYGEAFPEFKNDAYNIADVQFELHAGDNEEIYGFGFSEGPIKYEAVMENGEAADFEGPYKFYFSYDGLS